MSNRRSMHTESHDAGCFGYCRRCEVIHSLGVGSARQRALSLMAELEQHGESSYAVAPPPSAHWSDADTREARGQMFGILECRDRSGETVILHAFSALFDGQREATGWVPPLLTAEQHQTIVLPIEAEIKTHTWRLQQLPPDSVEYEAERRQRTELSRGLLDTLHRLCQVHNFRGECARLSDAWIGAGGMPGGVGGCCAPKLLNYAATQQLNPIGLVEFYWGVPNRIGTREHRAFYPCCAEKCQQILGFMLCGIDEN